mmetsp:Transcript_4758/g.8304  ORF Transcript_4758/g.8304 Transcript_4758/m.8304 type:complete len:459 (-) Transcript_4758:3116-4492(-)
MSSYRVRDACLRNESVADWFSFNSDTSKLDPFPVSPDWCVTIECDEEYFIPDATASIVSTPIHDIIPNYISPSMRDPFGISIITIDRISSDSEWALCSLIMPEDGPEKMGKELYMFYSIGLSPNDSTPVFDEKGFTVKYSRLAISKITQEILYVCVLDNGIIVHSNAFQRFAVSELSMFLPGESVMKPGQLIRRLSMASAIDCIRCSVLNDNGICSCLEPKFDTSFSEIIPLESFSDLVSAVISSSQNRLMNHKVHGFDGQLVSSFTSFLVASAARTSRDSIPLFKTLFSKIISKPIPRLMSDTEDHMLVERSVSVSFPSSAGSNGVQNGFECEFCGKLFVAKYNLQRHLATVHEEARFYRCQYEDCNKTFKIQSYLDLHVRNYHLRLYQFGPCEFCGHKFTSQSNLQRHVSTKHAKKRPFLCEFCQKSFTSSYNLTRHAKVHRTLQADITNGILKPS